jgi:hypothetical protein
VYRFLVGKPEGKRDFKLRDTGMEGIDRIQRLAFLNMVLNLWVP